MANYKYNIEAADHGGLLKLQKTGLLGKTQWVPIDEWHTIKGVDAYASAYVLEWRDEARLEGLENPDQDAHSIALPDKLISDMDSVLASKLGCPGDIPYKLSLQHIGQLANDDFHIQLGWKAPTGSPVYGATTAACWLHVGRSVYRIPSYIRDICDAVEALNSAARLDQRMTLWANFQTTLSSHGLTKVDADGFIQTTHISHVTRFSFSLKSAGDGFDFDIIPFASGIDTDEAVTEDLAALPPNKIEQLNKDFKRNPNAKSRYSLDNGWYVIFDKGLQEALQLVHRVQRSDPETRRKFVRNPRVYFREILEDKFDEETIESIFVETEEYSARILDIGLWQPPVLPWVSHDGQQWVPGEEQFSGIIVGGKSVTLTPKEVTALQEQTQEAINEGKASVDWKGTSIPATQATLEALEQLPKIEKPRRPNGPEAEPGAGKSGDDNGKKVLQIVGNFDEVNFSQTLGHRGHGIDRELSSYQKTSPKPHQKTGLKWLKNSWLSGRPGVLLADDMGLGKTWQTLAFFAWLKESMQCKQITDRPLLVVAPTALLKNWEEEHDIHLQDAGLGHLTKAYGKHLKAIRQDGISGNGLQSGKSVLDKGELKGSDWILTTYETLRDYQHDFAAIKFAVIAFDEIQKIKTPNSINTQAAKAMNADFVIGLTGTPVENRLADLWCIMDRIHPGALQDLATFSKTYEKDCSDEKLGELKAMLSDETDHLPAVMLRRLKSDQLKDMPEKRIHESRTPMNTAQTQRYDEIIAEARQGSGQGKMLEILQKLRSISLHHIPPSKASDYDRYIDESARLKETFSILAEINKKHEKALIFLESREMQTLLRQIIHSKFDMNRAPMVINGAVSGEKRQKIVKEFSNIDAGGNIKPVSQPSGFDVLILSPKAAGVGLNITAANHVIHLSRWWNPAVEDQCTDRAFRIGQKKDVHVYYPLAIHPKYEGGSFDEKLAKLLEKKRDKSARLLTPASCSPAETSELFEDVVNMSHAVKSYSLEDIDTMEPVEFEKWVCDKINRLDGFKANMTQTSYDGGADVIARKGSKSYLIQVKHTQSSANCPDKAVEDVLRAKDEYGRDDQVLVIVTNARGIGPASSSTIQREKIVFIGRRGLIDFTNILARE